MDSLALLADAEHNLSDVAGLLIVGAITGRILTNPRRVNCRKRTSVLATFANALLLVATYCDAQRPSSGHVTASDAWCVRSRATNRDANRPSCSTECASDGDKCFTTGASCKLAGRGAPHNYPARCTTRTFANFRVDCRQISYARIFRTPYGKVFPVS